MAISKTVSEIHQQVSIVKYASTGRIIDAAEIFNKAMAAVEAGYLAPAGHCRFVATDKGRALITTTNKGPTQ